MMPVFLKLFLPILFESNASSTPPEGSLSVKIIWWKHNNKFGQYSFAKVDLTLQVNSYGLMTTS
jgi:CRISPR-associated protein Csd2